MKSITSKGMISGSLVAAAGLLVSVPAHALPWNLQVRPTAVPNSCDYSVFEPELKLTNTGTSSAFLSEVFAEFSFNAGANEIEAVHPEGTYAWIFDAQGGFVSWDGVTVQGPFAQAAAQFSAARRANQVWRVVFDPPNAGGQTILVPPGGFATVIVTLRRAAGQSPFDAGCDDFTKVERNAPAAFTDNKFFRLLFTSTQQLICERFNPTTIDPNSGIWSFSPFNNGCPAS
jgi:hypothetical protein